VYGSENACRLCRLASVPARQVHRLQTGDRLRLGSFAVQVFPALHRRIPFFRAGALPEGIQPPFTARQYRLDESFSFWVEAGGVSIFDNAGTPPELAVQADLLCLNPFHSLSYCQRLLERVQPKIILPTHWDDFWLPLSKPLRPSYLPPRLGFPPLKRFDPKAFQADLRNLAPQVKVFFPERLEVYSFESLLEG
jgi:L-ascorbate metabolism protein UlaG (beta-lactamase superfamily)